ncbi:type II toxin-antitoxin system RelE family toxin [Methanocalculus chunghsingensis]|uniref:type II toxin-antitoxin system RelE family toxin n=1 Tax=Methanocalculus chunghsingensis TaxID=156457 RepID=UPI001B8B0FE0
MTYAVLVSRTFQKQFQILGEDARNRIRNSLKDLAPDPFTPRSGLDIKILTDSHPKKYRLRVGEYRIIYAVDSSSVRIIEIFRRGREYR